MNYIIHLFLILNTYTNFHEFHVSKTDVNYSSHEEALQLTVHLFIDDFELGLKEFSDENLRLFDDQEYEKADSLIAIYLSKYLTFNIEGNSLQPIYLGKEISDDLLGAWCYLELGNLKAFDNIKIENSLLLKEFDDQKNIINIKVDNKSKAFYILDKTEYSKVINF